jgi:hypothetical protein
MDASRFCLWLSGYFELREDGSRKSLSGAQADLIRNKLSQVEGLEMCPAPVLAENEREDDTADRGNVCTS